MISPNALAQTDKTVETPEITHDAPIVAELIDYVRWLAAQDSSFPLTVGHIWTLYCDGVRQGRAWSEVCEDIGLPVREEW